MYQIIVAPSAKKQLKAISKLYKKAMVEAINDLIENPFIGKPLTRELTGRFSYKIGDYRILYTVNRKDEIVNVISAGHRAVIYD